MENKVKTRRRKDRKPSKIYHFRFETDLRDQFVKVAEKAGYNTTEALEVLMQKAIKGLLPKKPIVRELTPEEKELDQLDPTSKFLMKEMQRKTNNAVVLLRDFLTNELQLQNVVEGPMVKDIFGSLKLTAMLKSGDLVAVDIETQELIVYRDYMKVGETK